jgi:hypothetical protein
MWEKHTASRLHLTEAGTRDRAYRSPTVGRNLVVAECCLCADLYPIVRWAEIVTVAYSCLYTRVRWCNTHRGFSKSELCKLS